MIGFKRIIVNSLLDLINEAVRVAILFKDFLYEGVGVSIVFLARVQKFAAIDQTTDRSLFVSKWRESVERNVAASVRGFYYPFR